VTRLQHSLLLQELLVRLRWLLLLLLLLLVGGLYEHDAHHNHIDLQDTLGHHRIVQAELDEGYHEYQSRQMLAIVACSS